jgi:DNA polymerase/3'-5' exonuclease PolX
VVGSIRRKRPEVNDIDIIAIPMPRLDVSSDQVWRAIPRTLFEKLKAVIVKRGDWLITVTIPGHDSDLTQTWFQGKEPLNQVQVDIYRATDETWGVLELIRTGSKEHNVKLCAYALMHHMMLSAARGVMKQGTVIASRTEQEIFDALGIQYVPPEQREETEI